MSTLGSLFFPSPYSAFIGRHHYSPFTIHDSLFTVHCSPFTITVHVTVSGRFHHSPFTIHHSQFTVAVLCSLFTPYNASRTPHNVQHSNIPTRATVSWTKSANCKLQ